MHCLQGIFVLVLLISSSLTVVVKSARHGHYTVPNLKHLTDLFPHQTFSQGFSELFGGSNIRVLNNGSSVDLVLDKSSGSGFVSKSYYNYGFFSIAMKLPVGYTSGVVVAFYMSNAQAFPHAHDEIDFELLGHEKRRDYVLQTNIYGNGSTSTGREEKFRLWFDPTEEFHQYSLIWNKNHTVFLVDNIPIREVQHNAAMTAYPLKPMTLYSTIWDGSEWATHGGNYPVNYKYGPFIASFKDMEMEGCKWDRTSGVSTCSKLAGGQDSGTSSDPVAGEDFVKLSKEQRLGMNGVRERFMIYSYCKDPSRFKVLPSECK